MTTSIGNDTDQDLDNETSTQDSSHATRSGGGVTDYFAILGIGDTLCLQSTHKKKQRISDHHHHTGTGGDGDERDETLRAKEKMDRIREEEECDMLERFYREIVEVAIFTVHSDANGNYLDGTLATSNTMLDENDDSGDGLLDNGPTNEQRMFQPERIIIPSSPTRSVAESAITCDTTNNNKAQTLTPTKISIPNESRDGNKTHALPCEISGFRMLYKTYPAGEHPSWNQNDPSATIPHNSTDMSFGQDTLDMSINNQSLNTTFGNANTTFFGGKAQVYDADLNPGMGLRGTLLSQVHSMEDSIMQHQHSQEGDLSFSLNNSIDKGLNQSYDSSQIEQEVKPRKLGGLVGKRVKSILPILAASTKGAIDSRHESGVVTRKQYYVGYRRRGADEDSRPAVADLLVQYVRIHRSTIMEVPNTSSHHKIDTVEETSIGDASSPTSIGRKISAQKGAAAIKRGLFTGAGIAKRMAENGMKRTKGRREDEDEQDNTMNENQSAAQDSKVYDIIYLHEVLDLPDKYDEWIIPDNYHSLQIPVPPVPSEEKNQEGPIQFGTPANKISESNTDNRHAFSRMQKTFLFPHRNSPTSGESGVGMEAFVDGSTFLRHSPSFKTTDKIRRNPWSPVDGPPAPQEHSSKWPTEEETLLSHELTHSDPDSFMPKIVSEDTLPGTFDSVGTGEIYEYIPIIATRRQRVGEEERFREDPGLVEIGISHTARKGNLIMPLEEEDDDENDDDEGRSMLSKTKWSTSSYVLECSQVVEEGDSLAQFGKPFFIYKQNRPLGFLDTPFAARLLDRFPKKNYEGVPLPEEELPMFCYPTGCRLHRETYQDTPLPEHYGFVVKNERGDSIYVSCVSFMEPLTPSKLEQLNQISEQRKRTSLSHKFFCQRMEKTLRGQNRNEEGGILMGFDQMMTFEYKTICLISRYPFWTAFRSFLSHLHVLSGSSSGLPVERFISHLLLSVPVPKPGAQCILVPLPAIASPMVLELPPVKDLPLLDLSFRRLFSCLDAPTVVTMVIGFLALERKVIIMSRYPSLVSDVCELLRSLLFPFELCAPYVPRLTEPFMSCLDFPGAIFVGIHDDGLDNGLASTIRRNIPEDTAILDLDTGDIDCYGDRYEILKECWEIIPSEHRSLLISEIETICRDAELVPGQEPMGLEIEAALGITPIVDEGSIHLNDRAIRDSFLRFFCTMLKGYERFLLVPDIDFLVSGNEWFDTDGFLAAIKTQSRSAFVASLVDTQLFQSFIQRRTEASDVQCLLFDECLNEFHSSTLPFGRMTDDIDLEDGDDPYSYNLLVDQCAAEPFDCPDQDDTSIAETSLLTTHTDHGFLINNSGDLVTAPSRKNLPPGQRYVYCLNGHPHFPQTLDSDMFYPQEPLILSADLVQAPVPVLTRSDRELEVSQLRRKLAVSHRGVQRQRRCLFQLPKLMGSHFLSTWLMCIPSQISFCPRLPDLQGKFLLRALGALKILRARQRIVPDEAGYRCLIVACGRADSDRRYELVKIFGLLRSDGIFPSAVTLGQYTRAIAEGFSKQSFGKPSSIAGAESTVSTSIDDQLDFGELGNIYSYGGINFLDRNISLLEESGLRWKNKREAKKHLDYKSQKDTKEELSMEKKPNVTPNPKSSEQKQQQGKRRNQKSWFPVTCSSSFSPHWMIPLQRAETFDLMQDFTFVALWSRNTQCDQCGYIPLDEEIQASWDSSSEHVRGEQSIQCPGCRAPLLPKLGFSIMIFEKVSGLVVNNTLNSSDNNTSQENDTEDNDSLPPQLRGSLLAEQGAEREESGLIPYLSPSVMRLALEQLVSEHGESILEREQLRQKDPTVFYNLWWYCCRFSLPLPLAIESPHESGDKPNVLRKNSCAFAAYEKVLSLQGCQSAAKTVLSLQSLTRRRRKIESPLHDLIQSFDNKSAISSGNSSTGTGSLVISTNLLDDDPLLSNMSLQTIAEGDWSHEDLASILVKLVEACDKRDFYPVLNRILQCNKDRRAKYGSQLGVEIECYHTLLYLTRYQCTSAFHKFFPSTCKICKGYHFWCPHTVITIFDRMFRDALDTLREQGDSTPIHNISDIALGFRSVFGHLI